MLISLEGSVHACLRRLDRNGRNVVRVPLHMLWSSSNNFRSQRATFIQGICKTGRGLKGDVAIECPMLFVFHTSWTQSLTLLLLSHTHPGHLLNLFVLRIHHFSKIYFISTGENDVKFLTQNMKGKGIHYRCDDYTLTVKTIITAIDSIEKIFLEESLKSSRTPSHSGKDR